MTDRVRIFFIALISLLFLVAGCAAAPASPTQQTGEPLLYTINGYYLGVWNGDTLDCWQSEGEEWSRCTLTPPIAVPAGTKRILTNERRTALIDGERQVRFLNEKGDAVPYCQPIRLPEAADGWQPIRNQVSTECELSYLDGKTLVFVAEEEGEASEFRRDLRCDIPKPDALSWYWVKWELAAVYPDRVTIPRIALVDGRLICVDQPWKTLSLPQPHDEVLVYASRLLAVRAGPRVTFYAWDEQQRGWVPGRGLHGLLPEFVLPAAGHE